MRFILTTTRMLSIADPLSFEGKLWRQGRAVNCKSTRNVSPEASFLNFNYKLICKWVIFATFTSCGTRYYSRVATTRIMKPIFGRKIVTPRHAV